ncbi:transmembrane protein, putative [Bodo saltans]|uniref:Transmembrane protein, putative n=1 Tax=Bodo saltans TaxID=75058 RepID=A0A0S4J1E5_BODSA|nr:transmembrane protein, putative [Bodo saltans]|eukprot:CUG31405.1 transmembrane protein, putative [Bodo saltans]
MLGEQSVFASGNDDDAPSTPLPFDVNMCPDTLPTLQSQELRIIGRVVSFTADLETGGQRRTCAFKGWVGHITKDTVTMIDAIRFEDVAELHDPSRTEEIEMQTFPLVLQRNDSGPSPLGVAPASSTPSATSGRLPYVTFPRRKLRNVKFESDYAVFAPSRSKEVEPFLDSARAPLWFPHDAQKVRMFVRRYIVHTAQQNNNQRLSLTSFLLSRLPFSGEGVADTALLQKFVAEELADLIAADHDIVARNEQLPQLQAHQHQQPGGVAAAIPPIFDASTLTLRTTYMAIGEFACGIGLLLYSASVFTTEDVELVRDFLRQALSFSIAAGLVFVTASVCTAVSIMGVRRSPMNIVKCGARMFTTLGALGVGAATTASLIRFMFLTMKLGGTHFYENYVDAVTYNRNDVCDLFRSYTCSGWDYLCVGNSSSVECPSPHCPSNFTSVCQPPVAEDIRHSLLPLLVMSLAGAFFALLDGFMFMRLRRHAQQFAAG